MEYTRVQSGVAARLDVGDFVIDSLKSVALQTDLKSGHISGVGALRNFTLGYFQTDSQSYKKTTFSKPHELTNLTGFITKQDNDWHVHAHATLAGPDHHTVGGHLHKGEIAAAGEFFVLDFGQSVGRSHDDELGLDLLNF